MSIIQSLNEYNEMVESQQPLELEVRFKYTKNKSEFENIYNTLLHYGFKRDEEKHILKSCFYNDTYKGKYMNCETDAKENMRSEIVGLADIKGFCSSNILPDITTHIKKRKIHGVDNTNYDFKIAISKEINCTDLEIKDIFDKWTRTKKTFRLMTRLTLKHDDMPGLVVDLSIVKMKKNSIKLSDSGIFGLDETYEIEIEIDNHTTKVSDVTTLAGYIKKTIKYILCGKNDTYFPISETIKTKVLNEYRSLYTSSKYASFIGPSSYTLQKQNLSPDYSPCIKNDFCVTDKADGLRKLLYVSTDGKIYFITNTFPLNVQYTGRDATDESLSQTLIDGEYIKYDKDHNVIDLFAAFDIYFYKKGEKVVDIRKNGFQAVRYDKLKELIKLINRGSEKLYENSISFTSKKFHFIDAQNDLYAQCSYLLDTIKSPDYKYNTDGIIFSSSTLGVGMETTTDVVKNKKYAWKHSFKWKPPEFNTIDFVVKFPTNDKGESLIEHIYNQTDQTARTYQVIHLYVGNAASDEIMNPQLELLNGIKPSKSGEDSILFTPSNPFDKDAYKAYILLEENGNIYVEEMSEHGGRDVIYDANIVEFKYALTDDKRFAWVPLRIRYDKKRGNNKNTANSNWNSIHNPVTKEMLTDASIQVDYEIDNVYYNTTGVMSKTKNMRDFHNKFVKKSLYSDMCSENCSIIDYAVGKAGDLHKWLDQKSPFVLGIDLSKDNINNTTDGACVRYIKFVEDKHKHLYTFIEGDTTKRIDNNEFAGDNKISKQVMDHILGIKKSHFTNIPQFGIGMNGFDLGSIQFALHYMFESKLTLNTFILNCYNTIKLNGHLIGTCYDGEIVLDVLKDIKENDKKEVYHDGSKLLHIKKKYNDVTNFLTQKDPCGYKIGVFQDSINTENDEYLVHFKYLETLMNTYGFELIQNDSFETYYNKYMKEPKNKPKKMSKGEQDISFMNKAFIFKKTSEIDPKLVYQLNTQEHSEEITEMFISSKPERLNQTIVLNNS